VQQEIREDHLGISAAARTALLGKPVAWCGPTYRMVLEAWEQFCHHLHPAIARRYEAEHRLHLITGGAISRWSLDAPRYDPGRRVCAHHRR
jgi:hypothetical protein